MLNFKKKRYERAFSVGYDFAMEKLFAEDELSFGQKLRVINSKMTPKALRDLQIKAADEKNPNRKRDAAKATAIDTLGVAGGAAIGTGIGLGLKAMTTTPTWAEACWNANKKKFLGLGAAVTAGAALESGIRNFKNTKPNKETALTNQYVNGEISKKEYIKRYKAL